LYLGNGFYLFIFCFISCGTTKQLSPTEMKAISTKQFDANYDIVFRKEEKRPTNQFCFFIKREVRCFKSADFDFF